MGRTWEAFSPLDPQPNQKPGAPHPPPDGATIVQFTITVYNTFQFVKELHHK